MPKASLPNLPVSALFGVVKPSGPTSMAVINKIKCLVSKSRLFVESSKMEDHQKDKPKGKSRGREAVKLGQGGTLDPLADGVLGGSGFL
jgi:tRNA pseudouridine55 synthase